MEEIKKLFMEMSEKEVRTLLFPENEYKPLWRWMQTKVGKASVPDYDNMGWAARAKALSKLTGWPDEESGWVVDEISLRVTFVRYDKAK
jgi:hypothetical protein